MQAGFTLHIHSKMFSDYDFNSRIVYLPIRHHSPGCAYHVVRAIRELKPKIVLIEGPSDATELLPFISHPETKPPIAIFTTYVKRTNENGIERYSAYYPICDYSPELSAIRTAAEIGAKCEFIDLKFPSMIESRHGEESKKFTKPDNLMAERHIRFGKFIESACEKTGARDGDDLWDTLYELDYRKRKTLDFFRNVYAYCSLIRKDYTQEMLESDGTLIREAAMKDRIDFHDKNCGDSPGSILVVTGGFHTAALPETTPKKPNDPKTGPEDAKTLLLKYGFEQLDRLNGYASGMPSPEFYQNDWEEKNVVDLLVRFARTAREKKFSISPADEIAALVQMERLAAFRNHDSISREDFLDALRSIFVKGADDSDGLPILALARKFLAGDRIGNVPKDAGSPPIVTDFNERCAELKIALDSIEGKEIELDPYRKTRDRLIGRLFQQLSFLEIPFANRISGPDFLENTDLERMRERWKYRWTPDVESQLAVRSLYGSTVRDAAGALLLERFSISENDSGYRAAVHASRLILSACLMGLHDLSSELLERTAELIPLDHSFVSLVGAMDLLIGLHVSREPLEATNLHGIDDIALTAYRGACFLIPELCTSPESDEDSVIEALCTLSQGIMAIGETESHRELRITQLKSLSEVTDGNPTVAGAVIGILYGDGEFSPEELIVHTRGRLKSASDESKGSDFLRGLLRTARSILWQLPECVEMIHEMLRDWQEERFLAELPQLRLAFSSLTPRECDRLAKLIAEQTGLKTFTIPRFTDFTPEEMIQAAEINRRVKQSLLDDGIIN